MSDNSPHLDQYGTSHLEISDCLHMAYQRVINSTILRIFNSPIMTALLACLITVDKTCQRSKTSTWINVFSSWQCWFMQICQNTHLSKPFSTDGRVDPTYILEAVLCQLDHVFPSTFFFLFVGCGNRYL